MKDPVFGRRLAFFDLQVDLDGVIGLEDGGRNEKGKVRRAYD